MKRQNTIITILEWLLALAVGGLMAYLVLKNLLKEQRPLTNADIPQQTIDWFKGLVDGGSDIAGILGPEERDSAEWSQYEDIDSMLYIEDDLFIIYYSKKDSVVEKNKALISQRYAHKAVPLGELFMKNYPYPSQLNGRKLPIYLAKTVEDYASIRKQLGYSAPSSGSLGVFCFQYGISKIYTDGIVLSSNAWSVSDNDINSQTDDRQLKETLWHEMNHFMYFSNWDYTQTSEPSLWFTEGLAEYFCGDYSCLMFAEDHHNYELMDDFCDGNEYWVGLSAIICLEKQHNKSVISDVVSNSYKNSVDQAIQMRIPGESLKSWNAKWHLFMENNEYQQYIRNSYITL